MEQFSEEYIKEVRDIIKNNDNRKSQRTVKRSASRRYCGTLSGFGSG